MELQAIKDVVQTVALIAIPIVAAVIAAFVNWAISKKGSADRMVSIAIDILRSEPKGDATSVLFRQWAIQIMDRHADPKLPAEAANHLVKEALPSAMAITTDLLVAGHSGINDRLVMDSAGDCRTRQSGLDVLSTRLGPDNLVSLRPVYQGQKPTGWRLTVRSSVTSGEQRVAKHLNRQLIGALESLEHVQYWLSVDAGEKAWVVEWVDVKGDHQHRRIGHAPFNYHAVYTGRE